MGTIDPNDPTKLVGFDMDLVQAIMPHIGCTFVYQRYAFQGMIPSLQAQQSDIVVSSLWENPDRLKVVDFVSYMSAALGILVAKGNPKNLKTQLDLCGHGVAGQQGGAEIQTLQTWSSACVTAGKQPITIGQYPDYPSELLSVDTGRSDAICSDALAAGTVVLQKPTKYEVAFTVNTGTIVGAAALKGSPLIAKLYDGIKWYQDSGQYAAAMTKWGIPAGLSYTAAIVK